MTLTSQIQVKTITINGQLIKLVKLPDNICHNGWSTPKLYWKTVHQMEKEKAEIVIECQKLRGLIQNIELD